MALLDRVKARTGSDLSDSELQDMIDAIVSEMDARFGPDGQISIELGDPTDPWSRELRTLRLLRPLDTAQAVTIVERFPADSGLAGNDITLDATDYRVLHGGRTLQRLTGGTNGRAYWAPMVSVTYTPIGMTAARDEATIKLIQLDLSYRGLMKSERAGDYQWAAAQGANFADERESIFDGLAISSGLVMA